MAEIITKDRKEYNIWDKINGVWNRLNFLTSASSVDASDGKDLQTKVGAINGISSSSTATDENIAASIGYVNQELTELNTNLSNAPIYNPTDDYFYVNGKKWRKAGLNRYVLYSADDSINTLIKSPYGQDVSYPQDVSLCSFNSNGFTLKSISGRSAVYYSPKIDVTNYNYLCLKSASTTIYNQTPIIALLSSIDGYLNQNASFRYDDCHESGTFMADISAMSGEFYPCLSCSNGRDAIIYDFWLE